MAEKKKIALYWGSSCGGCEVAVLDIDEAILTVVEVADIYMWPVAMDFKEADVVALPDGFLDVAFFNGAVRNDHEEHMAHLLRKKTKALVAYGACACFGGIPGLANFHTIKELMQKAYIDAITNANPDGVLPLPVCKIDEGEVYIPTMYNRVRALRQVVDVDYFIPGCPPAVNQTVDAFITLLTKEPPERGHYFAGDKALCDTCEREKDEKKLPDVKRLHLTHASEIDSKRCFIEQGIICMGPVTRSGCGNRCINANMPCRGCYGPTEGISDTGAKFLSAITSIELARDEKTAVEFAEKFCDSAGTFYRFSLPISLLRGNVKKRSAGDPE
ncbi:MAG: oxidoreductase [bacterium]